MKTIMSEWMNYAENVLPADADPIQRQETCRAFYAGVWSALNALMEIGEEHVTEEQGVHMYESWRRECEDFVQLVRDGLA